MASVDAEDLPRANVKRIVKSKLTELSNKLLDEDGKKKDVQINKDTLLAFCESAKIFVHYLSASANEICQENKRQTINAEDVITAVADLDFPEFVEPLRAILEAFRKENQTKKSENKGKKPGKKRKADDAEGDKVQGEDADMEGRERVGSGSADVPEEDAGAATDGQEENEGAAAEDYSPDDTMKRSQQGQEEDDSAGAGRGGRDDVGAGEPERSRPDGAADVEGGGGEEQQQAAGDSIGHGLRGDATGGAAAESPATIPQSGGDSGYSSEP